MEGAGSRRKLAASSDLTPVVDSVREGDDAVGANDETRDAPEGSAPVRETLRSGGASSAARVPPRLRCRPSVPWTRNRS